MQKISIQKFQISRFLCPCAVLLVFLLLLLSPDVSFEYMKSSLKLCTQSLIPSLFPFMIMSDFLVSSGAGGLLKLTLGRLIGLILGTSREGSFSVLIGFLCGFPIGAKIALRLHGDGKISHRELLHIMSFCNIPSPAFICGTVGIMFDSTRFGILLFASLILSAAALGIAGRFFYRYEKRRTCSAPVVNYVNAFTAAVTSSATVMITVCAYVVFFSVLIGYAGSICNKLNIDGIIPLYLSGILEISNGMSTVSSSSNVLAPIIAAFFAGFSGLSVIFQIISLDQHGYINKKIFLLQKLLQGVLCAAVCFVLLKIFPCEINTSTPTLERITFGSYGLYICLLFFVSAILPLLATKLQRKKYTDKTP